MHFALVDYLAYRFVYQNETITLFVAIAAVRYWSSIYDGIVIACVCFLLHHYKTTIDFLICTTRTLSSCSDPYTRVSRAISGHGENYVTSCLLWSLHIFIVHSWAYLLPQGTLVYTILTIPWSSNTPLSCHACLYVNFNNSRWLVISVTS